MPPLIAFRVDASGIIGSGHLRRCLTLADALRARGAECIFISRAHPGNLNSDVKASGFELLELAPPQAAAEEDGYTGWLGASSSFDASETLAALEPYRDLRALVVDHYAIDARWQKVVRARCQQILMIDDLADRPHDVDILLHSVPVASGDLYRDLVPKGAVRLLGSRYALLRPEFKYRRRDASLRTGPISRVFVSFGGSDFENRCNTAIDVLAELLGADCRIDVVVGRSAPHLFSLRHKAQLDRRVFIHVDTPHVADLMIASDLAVGAGGTTSWERACLGLPAIVAMVAHNQRDSIEALSAAGAALALPGDAASFAHDLRVAVKGLLRFPNLLPLLSRAAFELVDGKGAERVAATLLPANLHMRRAVGGDSPEIWTWRNSDVVRAASLNTDPIPWEDHEAWFDKALSSPLTDLLICENLDNEAVGVVRFEISASRAMISIYLTPSGQGRGLGADVLKSAEAWLRGTRPEIDVIEAQIRAENARSIAAFRAADYEQALLTFKRDLRRA